MFRFEVREYSVDIIHFAAVPWPRYLMHLVGHPPDTSRLFMLSFNVQAELAITVAFRCYNDKDKQESVLCSLSV